MDVGTAKAPTIRGSQTCTQSRQSVSTSQSLFFKSGVGAAGNVIVRRQLKNRPRARSRRGGRTLDDLTLATVTILVRSDVGRRRGFR
jgi:hypothetical protein